MYSGGVTWPEGRGSKVTTYLESPTPSCLSLYHFQGATVMIKGTLLLHEPPHYKAFSIESIFDRKLSKSENAYFLLSFSDPLEKPLDGYVWNLRTRTSQSGPTSCHIYGAKQRWPFFTEIRLIKKERKNTSNPKQPSVPAYAGRALWQLVSWFIWCFVFHE